MCFIFPTVVPWYLWGESLWLAYFVPGLLRYALVLNATWLVNSAAHMWGNRPYDQHINPRENKFVAFSAIGKEESTDMPAARLHLSTPAARQGFEWKFQKDENRRKSSGSVSGKAGNALTCSYKAAD